MITLSLPYPVSSNRYWRPVRIGAHITIVPTKEAKAYREEIAGIARASGILTPITGRVAVWLQLYPHRPLDFKARMRKLGENWDDTVQCIDLGNCEKVASDALNGIVFADDKWTRLMLLQRMEPDEKGARLVVHVKPHPPAQPQQPLIPRDLFEAAEIPF